MLEKSSVHSFVMKNSNTNPHMTSYYYFLLNLFSSEETEEQLC